MSTNQTPPQTRVALGKRLRSCPGIPCHGVKPNWKDYSLEVRRAVQRADLVCYPSTLYEDVLNSLGRRTFPRNYYRFMGNKIQQTHLFQLLEVPHPRTRLYYGRNRAQRILEDFSPPFVAKDPVGSSQGLGVWLVTCCEDLDRYLVGHHPAYIQEYLPIDRDLRVVLVKGKAVHAYWRAGREGEFRHNVSRGGRISFEEVPPEAVSFAEEVGRRCGFEEVGLDICRFEERFYVLEANMVFGLEGFRAMGLDISRILCDRVLRENP